MTTRTRFPTRRDNRLYGRWVLANAVAELIGLGATGVLAGLLVTRSGSPDPVALAALMVASGVLFEGVLVGALQGWVLKDALPRLSIAAWIAFTALGAGTAWLLGMVPSTLLNLEADTGATPAEPGTVLMLALAALMGFALGPVLATPQWAVLRRYVTRAAWWIPANALAWALGMVVIFAGIDVIVARTSLAAQIALGIGALGLAGAVVGAVHGLALVRLLQHQRSERLK